MSAEELMLSNCGAGETLQRTLDSKEVKPVNLKADNPEYSLEGLMLNLKLQYFAHLMRTAGSLEKHLILGKTEGRMRREWLEEKGEAEDEMVGQHH